MAIREIHFEDLIGRTVRTAAGRAVGRIEDLLVEPAGEEYVVRAVLLVELGWWAKLLHLADQVPTFRALGRRYQVRAIPWEWLDFSDPSAPKFRAVGSS